MSLDRAAQPPAGPSQASPGLPVLSSLADVSRGPGSFQKGVEGFCVTIAGGGYSGHFILMALCGVVTREWGTVWEWGAAWAGSAGTQGYETPSS